MAVLELGWSSLAKAELYFTNERLETDSWDDLSSDDKKNTALNMAYNRIYYCPDYSVPVAGSETATQKTKLIKVQCEMAYYLALHLADEDRRKGLQAQGVVEAGIVKEAYSKSDLMELPIPPFIDAILDDEGYKTKKAFSMVDIDRDEDEKVSKDVVDL